MTAALCATVLAGALSVSTVAPAASAAPRQAASGVSAASAVSAVTAAKAKREAGSFRVSSFNVLGASHTPPGGKWDSGRKRIRRVNRLLNRHSVQVAGFQEMQGSQLTRFLKITDGSWAVYPGFQLKKIDSENSIGWRTDKFELVDASTINIPYFDGSPRAMPVVLLRDKVSGMLTYFSNFHNPAETSKYRHQDKWRRKATNIEIALQNQLTESGIPRIMTGDMNERADYFCAVSAGSKVKAARPNTYRKAGKCYANKPRAVDWILGSRRATYSDYVEDRSHLVDITTDHPVIVGTVTVQPERLPNGWSTTAPPHFVPRRSWHR